MCFRFFICSAKKAIKLGHRMFICVEGFQKKTNEDFTRVDFGRIGLHIKVNVWVDRLREVSCYFTPAKISTVSTPSECDRTLQEMPTWNTKQESVREARDSEKSD